MASVAQNAPSSKTRLPVAIGVANLDSREFRTILVLPPESWGLIKFETEEERIEREKKKLRRRVQSLANITDEEFLKNGKSPEDVAKLVLSLTADEVVFSLDRKHDLKMLSVLSPEVAGKIELRSTTALANEFTSPDRAMNLQLQCRLRIGLYPRNEADVRWIVPWIDHCRNKGRGP